MAMHPLFEQPGPAVVLMFCVLFVLCRFATPAWSDYLSVCWIFAFSVLIFSTHFLSPTVCLPQLQHFSIHCWSFTIPTMLSRRIPFAPTCFRQSTVKSDQNRFPHRHWVLCKTGRKVSVKLMTFRQSGRKWLCEDVFRSSHRIDSRQEQSFSGGFHPLANVNCLRNV